MITHFGGRNAASGALGTGVQNSPKSDFPAPNEMLVTWLSFQDGNFWQAKIDLPEKEIAKLLDEKIQGVFVSNPYQKVQRYNKLVVKVGSQGKVYIYLGGVDIKLIGKYQGHKIDIPWGTHIKDTWSSSPAQSITKYQYVSKVQQSRKSTLIKAEQFNEKVFDPIKWKLSVNQPNQLIAYTAQMLNGEDQTVLDNVAKTTLNSIPKLFIFDVKNNAKISRYRVTVDPDLYAFFHKYFNAKETINFNMDFPNADEAHLYLEQGAKKAEYKKIEIEEMKR